MKSILGLLVLAVSFAANAQVQIGSPAYGGNGCPQGTASISVTPDGQTMSVLFDQFQAEAGNTTGRRIARASCNMRIPMHVPAGYSVSIIHADYRGFAAVPGGGAYATFNSEFFFAGGQSQKTTKKITGPMNDEFLISSDSMAAAWSPCGTDVILAVNTSATSMSNSAMQQTMMIVDSLDMTQQNLGLIYSINYRRCTSLR